MARRWTFVTPFGTVQSAFCVIGMLSVTVPAAAGCAWASPAMASVALSPAIVTERLAEILGWEGVLVDNMDLVFGERLMSLILRFCRARCRARHH